MHISRQKSITSRSIKKTGALIVIIYFEIIKKKCINDQDRPFLQMQQKYKSILIFLTVHTHEPIPEKITENGHLKTTVITSTG